MHRVRSSPLMPGYIGATYSRVQCSNPSRSRHRTAGVSICRGLRQKSSPANPAAGTLRAMACVCALLVVGSCGSGRTIESKAPSECPAVWHYGLIAIEGVVGV